MAEPTPKPEPDDPTVDYPPTTRPSAPLPHFWVERNGIPNSLQGAIEREGLTLLTHVAGKQPWCLALASLEPKSRMPIRCLAIGPQRGADLLDVQGAWPSLSEVELPGAVLVRPDGHVAWRAQSRADTPAAQLARPPPPPRTWRRLSTDCLACHRWRLRRPLASCRFERRCRSPDSGAERPEAPCIKRGAFSFVGRRAIFSNSHGPVQATIVRC